MPIAVIYIAAGILFLGAAHDHLPYLPYGYFRFLGIVAMGAFLWAFFVSFKRNATLLPWIFLLFAVLFNPVMKAPLTKELWIFIDITAGALLLFTQNKIKQQATCKII